MEHPAEPVIPSESTSHAAASVHIAPDSGQREVEIHLVRDLEQIRCFFWFGLFGKGEGDPKRLLDDLRVELVLERAAKEGLRDPEPVMFSDSTVTPPLFFYLMPQPERDLKERAKWLANLISTISSWKTPEVGFHISKHLLQEDDNLELTEQITRELVKIETLETIYLYQGSFALNPILNRLIQLRQELCSGDLKVLLFH